MFTPFTEGEYRIVLQDRETGKPIDGCDLSLADDLVAQYTRGPHLYSKAFVQLKAPPVYDCTGCGGAHCSCEPNGRAVELAFYRDDWPEAAWIGPVTGISSADADGLFTIVARDRLWWLEGATSDRELSGSVPANRAFLDLVRTADRYEPSGLIYEPYVNQVDDCDITATLDVAPGDLIWSPLLSLDTLVWWTVVGEQLYFGCPTLPLDCGPELKSSVAWLEGGVTAERSFGSVATRVKVVGKDGVTAFWPTDGDAEPVNGQGKRTIELSDTNLDTVEEAEAVARIQFLANRYPSDFLISGESSLGPNVDFGMHELIPGRCHDVVKDTGCLRTSENRVLQRVVVDIATVSGDGGARALREVRVAADFSPLDTASQPTSISA